MGHYDLIVRAARVIDAAQELDGPADIAVQGSRIGAFNQAKEGAKWLRIGLLHMSAYDAR